MEEKKLAKSPPSFSWHRKKPSMLSCCKINKKSKAIPVNPLLAPKETQWTFFLKLEN
jgi:hypothetical protein